MQLARRDRCDLKRRTMAKGCAGLVNRQHKEQMESTRKYSNLDQIGAPFQLVSSLLWCTLYNVKHAHGTIGGACCETFPIVVQLRIVL